MTPTPQAPSVQAELPERELKDFEAWFQDCDLIDPNWPVSKINAFKEFARAALAAQLSRLQADNEALRDSVAAKADRIDRLGEMVERLQAGGGEGEPVLFASPEQLQAAITSTLAGFTDIQPESGGYLPVRPTPGGKFTAPLYAHLPAAPALVPLTAAEADDLEREVVNISDSLEEAAHYGVRLGYREARRRINGLTVGGDGGEG